MDRWWRRGPTTGSSAPCGTIAVASATINVVGGFIITDRMLKMFHRAEKPAAAKAERR